MNIEITPCLIIIWSILGLTLIGHCIFWINEFMKDNEEDLGGIL
jgi:hypothetical protein